MSLRIGCSQTHVFSPPSNRPLSRATQAVGYDAVGSEAESPLRGEGPESGCPPKRPHTIESHASEIDSSGERARNGQPTGPSNLLTIFLDSAYIPAPAARHETGARPETDRGAGGRWGGARVGGIGRCRPGRRLVTTVGSGQGGAPGEEMPPPTDPSLGQRG